MITDFELLRFRTNEFINLHSACVREHERMHTRKTFWSAYEINNTGVFFNNRITRYKLLLTYNYNSTNMITHDGMVFSLDPGEIVRQLFEDSTSKMQKINSSEENMFQLSVSNEKLYMYHVIRDTVLEYCKPSGSYYLNTKFILSDEYTELAIFMKTFLENK